MEHLLQKSKCSIFLNIFKYMIFQRCQKTLFWSKGSLIVMRKMKCCDQNSLIVRNIGLGGLGPGTCNCSTDTIGLELAIDPPPHPPHPTTRGNFVHYDFLKLHYIRHKIKDVSPLRVAALTCNITLYMLPPPPPHPPPPQKKKKIALNIPDNVSTMTCSYIFAC